MGFIPPLPPLTISKRLVIQVNDATARNVKAAMDVLNRGPRRPGQIILLPPGVTSSPIITQPINCRGCGFTHSDEQCPYCGRGRA